MKTYKYRGKRFKIIVIDKLIKNKTAHFECDLPQINIRNDYFKEMLISANADIQMRNVKIKSVEKRNIIK